MKSLLQLYGILTVGLATCAFGADTPTDNVNHTNDNSKPIIVKEPFSQTIERELRQDPLYNTARINLDVYRGLVVVHGTAPNANLISVLNDKLRRTKGVDIVYNYMQSPEIPTGQSAVSVSYDNFSRVEGAGVQNNSFAVTGRLRDRLAADPVLADMEFDVDAYAGLVILNGVVTDPALAQRAKDIAAHTEGVTGVLSYLGVAGDPGTQSNTAPIYAREIPEEMIATSVKPQCAACGVR